MYFETTTCLVSSMAVAYYRESGVCEKGYLIRDYSCIPRVQRGRLYRFLYRQNSMARLQLQSMATRGHILCQASDLIRCACMGRDEAWGKSAGRTACNRAELPRARQSHCPRIIFGWEQPEKGVWAEEWESYWNDHCSKAVFPATNR